MSNAQFGDAARDHLRVLIAKVEHELEILPLGTDGSLSIPGVRTAWANVVAALALGPAPETRACPTCKQIGMRAASRCSRCWSALVPLAPSAVAA